MPWGRAYGVRPHRHASRPDPRVLQMTEIAILRRLDRDERPGEIAAGLGIRADTVSHTKKRLRDVFGVTTDRELLAHPDVRRQMEDH